MREAGEPEKSPPAESEYDSTGVLSQTQVASRLPLSVIILSLCRASLQNLSRSKLQTIN
jgi:hypothetical protein